MANPIHYRYDSFLVRFAAAIIDGFIVVIPSAILEMLVDMAGILWLSFIFSIFTSVAVWAYFIIGHGLYGRTVGKKTQKLRVVDFTTEQPISMNQAFWRELPFIILAVIALIISGLIDYFSVVDESVVLSLAYVVIFLNAAFLVVQVIYCLNNPERRALHDLIGGTVVVRENVPLEFATNAKSTVSED